MLFPNDKKVTVLRANGTTYRCLQSDNLMRTHKWTPAEVRCLQNTQNDGPYWVNI